MNFYQIEYPNGFIQIKNLISREIYDNIVKPLKDSIIYFESIKRYDLVKLSNNLLREYITDSYFVEGSPIFSMSVKITRIK